MTSMTFSCPTNELLLVHFWRSITAATKTGPFIELGVTMWVPSGDQLHASSASPWRYLGEVTYLNRERFVLGDFKNGARMSASRPQSSVLQILTELSSDCEGEQ